MSTLPLQIVDSFLLNYHVGDALFVGFLLGALSIFPMRSRQLLTMHVMLFGLLFLVIPGSMFEVAAGSLLGGTLAYRFFGLALVLVGPVLYASAER